MKNNLENIPPYILKVYNGKYVLVVVYIIELQNLQDCERSEELKGARHQTSDLIVVKIPAEEIKRFNSKLCWELHFGGKLIDLNEITHKTFNWCRPRNILLDISWIWFSANCRSTIREAPSKAFASMASIWFRCRSSFMRWGKRPKNPSDLMCVNSLSLNFLLAKQTTIDNR